jgi:hypothetical protein
MAAKKKSQLTSSRTRARAKPLRTDADYVRKGIPGPGVPLIEGMSRAMTAYAEFPVRLMKCTSPVQLWREYLRFGEVLFSSFAGLSQPGLPRDEERHRSGNRLQRRRRSARAPRAGRRSTKPRSRQQDQA